MARATRAPLLTARTHPGHVRDTATREAWIARQAHPARRRRRLRRAVRVLGRALGLVLGVAVCVVVGTVAVHVARTSAVFAVARIDVEGLQRVPEATVLGAARIEPGTNLLTIEPEIIEDRVEALPAVRRARVVRHLPSRIVIAVEERQPYALVAVAGGLAWTDADGRLVGVERHAVSSPLPILSGIEPPAAGPDQPVGDRLRTGLAILRAIQRTGGRLAGRISEIDLTGAAGPILYTLDGVEVRLGQEGWAERLARFDGVLAELEDRGERVEQVDLRYRDLVVIRPRRPI